MDAVGSTSHTDTSFSVVDLCKTRLVTSNASKNPNTGDWDVSLTFTVDDASPRGRAMLSFLKQIDVWFDE